MGLTQTTCALVDIALDEHASGVLHIVVDNTSTKHEVVVQPFGQRIVFNNILTRTPISSNKFHIADHGVYANHKALFYAKIISTLAFLPTPP